MKLDSIYARRREKCHEKPICIRAHAQRGHECASEGMLVSERVRGKRESARA